MSFRDAVVATQGLANAFRAGLQALRRTDRGRINCTSPRNLTGSVDLDGALSHSHAHDPRWDYGIGLREGRRREVVIWVEVHSASSSHIEEVLNKLSWLKRWLRSSAPLLNQMPKEYVWVASGRVALSASSRQRRQLASRGIRFAGKRLELP